MLQTAPKSSPRRRWRPLLIAAAVLLALLLIITEIVLAAGWPKKLVLNLVEKQLGLRITAASLSTGIFGYTTLDDVTVTLPLADKAFLKVPTLKLNHSWLPGIIFGSFTVHHITIDHPTLTIQQTPQGTWNLLEVLQLLGHTGGGSSQQQAAGKSDDIPLLPDIDITDGSILIADNQNRSATIDHLDLTGVSQGPLVWQYTAAVPNQLRLVGKLAPGGPWAHEVELQLQNAQPWFKPWVAAWNPAASLQAHWTGRVSDGNLVGRLDIEKLNYASFSLAGPFDLSSGAGAATLKPDGITVSPTSSHSLDTRLSGGSIVISASGIQSQNVGVDFAQGRASLDGRFNFTDNTAALHAAWRDFAFPSSVNQSGDLQLSYAAPLGQPHFSGTLQNHGTTKSGQWNALLTIAGAGASLQTLDLTFNAQKLRYDANTGENLDLTGLTASLGPYPGGILLRDLSIGSTHPVAGTGGYSFATNSSWLSLDGRIQPTAFTHTLNVDLNAWQNHKRIHLQQLYVADGALGIYVNGDYIFDDPKPVSAHAYVTEQARFASVNAQTDQFRGALQSTVDLTGTISPMDLAIVGWARGRDVYVGSRPIGDLKLDLRGSYRQGFVNIKSRDIQLLGGNWTIGGQYPVHNSLFRIDNLSVQHLSLPLAADSQQIAGTLDGKWSIDVHGLSADRIDIEGAADIHNLVIGNRHTSNLPDYLTFDNIQIDSTRLKNGRVEFDPITLTRNLADHAGSAQLSLSTTLDNPTTVFATVSAKNWPLSPPGNPATALISAAGNLTLDLTTQSAAGNLDLGADVLYKFPTAPLPTINSQSSNTQPAQNNIPPDKIPSTGNPPFRSEPQARPGNDQHFPSTGNPGEGEGGGSRNQLQISQRPSPSQSTAPAAPFATSHSELATQPAKNNIPSTGIPGEGEGAGSRNQPQNSQHPPAAPFATFRSKITLSKRQLDISAIDIRTLNGSAAGNGFYDLDKPYTARLNLDWKNLDLAALKPFSTALATLSGTTDGALHVEPTTDPRALGPLAITLAGKSHNIEIHNFTFGDFQAAAFVAPDRFVLDPSPVHPTQIAFADGIIGFWGRVARHPGDVYQSLIQINLDRLQLDTLIPAGTKVAKTPGLLSGTITILGRPRTPQLASGSGTLHLSQSDLAGTGPIALLYDLMHVAHDPKKPTGSGEIAFTLANESADITAMRYFDRGTEVRLSGEIADLTNLPDNPIALVAVGSARPLASINIPGLADFDAVLGAIQHDAISIKVGGTLNNPKTTPILFGDIGQEMKNLLFGDAQPTSQ